MRVAWVIHGPLEQPTGGYVYDRQVIERSRQRGDRVDVVSVAPGSDPAALSRRLAALPIDAVVGDALGARELGHAFAASRGIVTRVLLVHHMTSWEEGIVSRETLRTDEARAFASSDAVIATSGWTAARVGEEHGRTADVVEPGADRLARVPRCTRADDGRLALAFVGSLIPRKRLGLLLHAMDRLADPAVTLSIVGDRTRDVQHAAALAARIADSAYLRGRVQMLGVIDDHALARLFAASDALVLPSSLEGYGMALTEALHAGLPVIAARAGAIPGVVGGAGSALLLDDDGWVEGLRRFVRDRGLRDRMRRAAEPSAACLPTWDEATTRFRDAVNRAVVRGGRAPSSGRAP